MNNEKWIAAKNELIDQFIRVEKENLENGNKKSDSYMVDELWTVLMKTMKEIDDEDYEN